MRYEDASQTGSLSNELPVARDDSDALAAGSRGPATGNVITGDGTQTGSIGADILTAGAQLTALEGAGGSDSDFTGGKLSVAGEFGKLSVDAAGNYSYLANEGAPESARDHFTYRLTDTQGNSDAARLTIEIGKTQAQTATQQVVVGPDGVVVLPAGVELNDIRVVGRDLVVTLPDGSQMVIKDGAVFVPQLVLDNVEIPATNLAALLIDSEPRPAAGGQPPSSGGNFEVPVGPLDPGVPLGDLIPPTELDYTPPDLIDVGVDIENRAPFASASAVNVSEEGLAAGVADSTGSPDTTNSASVLNGSILAGDPDNDDLTITLGIPTQALESRDVPIVWALSAGGTVLTGTAGGATVVVVTMQSDGDYSVVLSRPVDHPNGTIEDGVSFIIPVSVSDGEDVVSVAITVTIEDDSPSLGSPVTSSSVLLDETDGANPLSSGAPIVATSAAAMVGASVNYGADGQGLAPVYSLSLLGGVNSLVSNVQTAAGNLPITLTLTSATLITATYQSGGTQTAFTIQMNANGTVTVTQFTALEHLVDGPPGPAHDDALTLNSAALGNLVNANVTFRDFDGDSVPATVAIGGSIIFEDDGPSINVNETIPTNQAGLVLLTGDDGTEGAGSTTDASTANFAGVFSLVSDGGGDGAAATPAIVYSLGLLVAAGADSNLDSNGQSIFLYNVGGVVVGSTSATAPSTATAASVVFALSVNGAGVVTLTQYQQIDHPIGSDLTPTGTPFTDQIAVLGSGFVEIIASATITDNDDDTASDVERFDFGDFVRFADDGPDIGAALVSEARIRIDETDGVVAAGGESDPVGGDLGTVTMDLGTLFTVSTVSASADSPTTIVYALTLGAAVGGLVDSGLDLSTTNASIYLYKVGTTVVGSTSLTAPTSLTDASIAFTVSINASTGAVTLTQFLAVEHPIPGASHDEDSSGLLAGALNVTVTATDFDGDTDAASIDLGSIIRFEDDGPTINVTVDAALEPNIRLTTGDAGTEGEGSTNDFTTSGNFGGVFGLTSTPGSDGATTPSLVFTLGTAGGASGLFSHGAVVNLYYIGTTVVGSTATDRDLVSPENTVFDVTVSALGVVSLTQYQQVDHPLEAAPNAAPFADQLISMLNDASITLTASSTITDNDLDVATDRETINIGANLRFADDGPVINMDPEFEPTLGSSVTLDETDFDIQLPLGFPISETSEFPMITADVDYGADGKGPDPVFGLSLDVEDGDEIGTQTDSGFLTAVGDRPITLTLTSATLITATYNDGNDIAFTIQMNADGTVTVTQFVPLEHLVDGPSASDHDDALDLDNALGNLVNATVTYQDFDGDTATATIAIGAGIVFRDDGPDAQLSGQGVGTVVLDETRPETTDTPGGTAPTGTDSETINLSAGFTTLAVDYGADGAGSVRYAFLLSAASVGSGLYALQPSDVSAAGVDNDGIGQGDQILLSVNASGTVITGAVNNVTYFTITLDPATGIATFAQVNPIWHSVPGSSYDEGATLTTLAATNFQVQQTVTDADGDVDTAVVNLGAGVFTIQDDGPDAQLSGQGVGTVVLDETRPETTDTPGGTAPTGTDSETINLSAGFTTLAVDYGADGAGSVRYAFLLSAASVGSGLYALQPSDVSAAGVDNDGIGQGDQILLSVNASGTVITGAVNNVTYFTITLDPATGIATFAQVNPIWHSVPGSSYDEGATLTTLAATNFQVQQTVTDADGDVDTAVVNLGAGVFTIQDDGPDAQLSGQGVGTVVLDETRPETTDTPGGTAPTGTDSETINLSAGFTTLAVDYGADGAGSVRYAFLLSAASVGSGLYALQPSDVSAAGVDNDGIGQGDQILLSVNASGTVITGAVNNVTYFTITLDPATGIATFAQVNPIWHSVPGSSYDEGATLTTLAATNFQVQQTVTDADGDVDTAVVNLGAGVFTIQDDGPDAQLSGQGVGTVVLDETRPETTDTPGGTAPTGTDSETINLSAGFTTLAVDYGADGAGSVRYAFLLSAASVGSGLYALQPSDVSAAGVDNDGIGQGDQILLSVNASGTVITGAVNNVTYFTITLDPATGIATFAQVNPIWHSVPGSSYDEGATLTTLAATNFQVQQTVTDADGDVDTAVVNLGAGVFTIQDDGPDAQLSGQGVGTVVLDETRPETTDTPGGTAPTGTDSETINLSAGFTTLAVDYGADGAGSVRYAFLLSAASVGSGLYALQPSDVSAAGVDNDGIGQGDQILLSVNASGTVITGAVNNVTYFTITLDPATGIATFAQVNPIWHSVPGSSYDEGATLTTLAATNFQVQQTVTDADGDVDTAVVNLGAGVFTIQDDGPDAQLSGQGVGTVVLDETRPETTDTPGGTAPTGTDSETINLSAGFTTLAVDYGADGAGSVRYAFLLSAASVGSGLYALQPSDVSAAGVDNDGIGQGDQILLSVNASGTVITGAVNNVTYFTITLDPATGIATFAQVNPIWHSVPGSSYDEGATLTTLAATNFQVQQTVTDADGDVDTAVVNLGAGVFTIQDDGPDAQLSGQGVGTVVLDETRPETTDTPGGTAPTGTDSETINLSAGFTTLAVDYGADGAGSVRYAFLLSAASVGSGLYALQPSDVSAAGVDNDGIGQGDQILLSVNASGTVITGAVNNVTYFTITLDPATGIATFAQVNPIWHSVPGSSYDEGATLTTLAATNFQVQQTVTDADGDVDTAVVNLGAGVFTIQDDGPDAQLSGQGVGTVVLDETRPETTDTPGGTAPTGTDSETINLSAGFTTLAVDYGADGAGSVRYAFLLSAASVGSGLYALQPSDVSAAGVDNDGIGQGDQILLSVNASGTVITGAVNNVTYFTITLDPATGIATFAQVNPIWHSVPGSSYDEGATLTTLAATNFQVQQTVTDADGDVDTAVVNLGAGVFTIQDDGPALIVSPPNPVTSLTATGDFALDVGADGFGAGTPLDTILNVSLLSGTIGTGTGLQNITITSINPLPNDGTNTSTLVEYAFTFTYDGDSGAGVTPVSNGGIIAFDTTTNDYSVTLNNSVGYTSVLQTNTVLFRDGYEGEAPNNAVPQEEVTTSQLAPNFWVQFLGYSGSSANPMQYDGTKFTAPVSFVSISNAENGVASDTIQQQEVLDINFFTANPMGDFTPEEPRAVADSFFVEIDLLGNDEDIVIVLKLVDPNDPNGAITYRTLIVGREDIYDDATGSPPGYTFNLDNNDGVIVIEPDDYRLSTDLTPGGDPIDYVIVGLQFVTSTENLVGSGYEIDGTVGVGLPDETLDAFTLTATNPDTDPDGTVSVDQDVTKIVNIGIKVTEGSPQPITLNFTVTATDADGDTTGAVPLTVTFPASVMPVVLDTNHDGSIAYLSHDAGVAYDYDGDGTAEATGWVAAGDSILVRDADGNGTVTSASEFVFGSGGLTDLEALHAQYGAQLDASDADFVMFMLWNDANSNGVADAGELESLADAGVTSIGLVSNGVSTIEAGGDVFVNGSGTFAYVNDNGESSTGLLTDVGFRVADRETDLAQRFVGAANTSGLVAAAVAAAGLAAGQAAAHADPRAAGGLDAAVEAGGLGEQAQASISDKASDVGADRSLLGGESRDAANDGERSEIVRFDAASDAKLVDDQSSSEAPAELLEGTEASANDAAAASLIAPMIVMPSAEALESLGAHDQDGGQSSGLVERVIAEALAGGTGGGEIDALLATLPGGGSGGNAALDALASQDGAAVPAWDIGNAGHFESDVLVKVVAEAMTLHHDAVQPAING